MYESRNYGKLILTDIDIEITLRAIMYYCCMAYNMYEWDHGVQAKRALIIKQNFSGLTSCLSFTWTVCVPFVMRCTNGNDRYTTFSKLFSGICFTIIFCFVIGITFITAIMGKAIARKICSEYEKLDIWSAITQSIDWYMVRFIVEIEAFYEALIMTCHNLEGRLILIFLVTSIPAILFAVIMYCIATCLWLWLASWFTFVTISWAHLFGENLSKQHKYLLGSTASIRI